jgi:hypothetical protein
VIRQDGLLLLLMKTSKITRTQSYYTVNTSIAFMIALNHISNDNESLTEI